jgi:hypothetical protein
MTSANGSKMSPPAISCHDVVAMTSTWPLHLLARTYPMDDFIIAATEARTRAGRRSPRRPYQAGELESLLTTWLARFEAPHS